MRSEEYWARRMEDLNEAELRKGEAYIKKQNEEYDKALARIRKETEAWYGRLAKNNNMTMAEARKLLTANELKEFHWDVQEYIKRGRENAVDQRWVKQLENASAKVHISRLEELETKIRQEVELLTARRVSGTTEVLGNIYKDGYYKGIYEVQRGVGEGIPFARLDEKRIDKVLSKPWAPDGRNFSSRIWTDKDKLLSELQTVLTQDLIRGESSDKMIADFAERMGVSKRAAKRLILTEGAYFSGQSRLDGYRETGVSHYKFVATLDSRTSEECRHMDGKVIPTSEAKAGVNYPPLHAYCRSTTIPVFDDDGEDELETGERAARDEDGKTYYVPADMTYKEWAEKHAPKDAEKPPEPEQPRPAEPPKVKTADPSGLSSGREGESTDGPYAPEPEKWYDETGKTAPKVYPVKELPLDDLEPDKPRKLGDIDLKDSKAISDYLDNAEQAIKQLSDEHALVISDAGEVFHTRGSTATVDPAVIGKAKLQKAIVTHNHPDYAGESGGSFSNDDVIFFFTYALSELRAVDSEYLYTLKTSRKVNLTVEEITALVLKAEEKAEMSLTIEEALQGYDLKHLTMLQLVTLIKGLLYERKG